MKPNLKLSVIIPHLNEPDNLRRCLLSLDAQRREDLPFEIIVVDNGSAELPYDVCRAVPGVRLEVQAIPGPGPARNRGVEVAASPLLAFIDADCIAQPGWASSIVRVMAQRPDIDFLGGDIGILMKDPERPSAIEAYERIYGYRARLYVERHGYAATGNMAVRARVFAAVGPFGGLSTMEDTDWGQRATKLGHRALFVPDAKVLTPSCECFTDLAMRWDRHVAHEFGEYRAGALRKLRWFVYCLAIALSPTGEALKVLRSDRISGLRSRCLALFCVTRIRFYRARKMIGMVFGGNASTVLAIWNREAS